MPVHTPGAISSGGNDDQGAQTTNLAAQYPSTVDSLPGMQYPDMPGGPDHNAPRSGQQQISAPWAAPGQFVVKTPVAPTDIGLPAYGTLGTELFEPASEV